MGEAVGVFILTCLLGFFIGWFIADIIGNR